MRLTALAEQRAPLSLRRVMPCDVNHTFEYMSSHSADLAPGKSLERQSLLGRNFLRFIVIEEFVSPLLVQLILPLHRSMAMVVLGNICIMVIHKAIVFAMAWCKFHWRAGTSQPSRPTAGIFRLYIPSYFYTQKSLGMCHGTSVGTFFCHCFSFLRC